MTTRRVGNVPKGGNLDELVGWPVLLVFWSTYQEKSIPFLPALEKLAALVKDVDIPILILSNEKKETLDAFLKDHPLPYPISYDWSQNLYKDFAIAKVGLPNAKLIGIDGAVVWEGNPDWKAEYGSYLDEPIADMIKKQRLPELKLAGDALVTAEAALARGDKHTAVEALMKVSKIDAVHPFVVRAKARLDALEHEAQSNIDAANAFVKDGHWIQGVTLLQRTATDFKGLALGEKARVAADKRGAEPAYQGAKKLENRLRLAEKHLEANALDKAKESLEITVGKLEPASDPWLAERAHWLADKLAGAKNGKALLEDYDKQFPGALAPK